MILNIIKNYYIISFVVFIVPVLYVFITGKKPKDVKLIKVGFSMLISPLFAIVTVIIGFSSIVWLPLVILFEEE